MRPSVVFTGGGTGGHIFPGLAVADELRQLCRDCGNGSPDEGGRSGGQALPAERACRILWIGSSKGMDRSIVEQSGSVEAFYGIPTGKLRRYFSLENLVDVFKIIGGCIASFFLLLRLRPAAVFSKGGFVSVPPCLAAGLLGIPVYTHECDFSPGLATRLNSRVAKKVLLSYPETASYFGARFKGRLEVTGNPVRPVFYNADGERGRKFLDLHGERPVLLVLGGSSGARQINELVLENLGYLTERFQVVHQTGGEKAGFDEAELPGDLSGVYKHYSFIHGEMPDVLACADVVLSRSGANSLWECAVLGKAMVLVPLCGSGTRGDQVENARFFVDSGAALSLVGGEADSEHLRDALDRMLDEDFRKGCERKALELGSRRRPAKTIAELLHSQVFPAQMSAQMGQKEGLQ